jgi:hypothetical protein
MAGIIWDVSAATSTNTTPHTKPNKADVTTIDSRLASLRVYLQRGSVHDNTQSRETSNAA